MRYGKALDMNQTDDFGCPIVPDEDQELLYQLEVFFSVFLLPTIGFLGILGNVLISVIVMQSNMRNSFNDLMGET